MRPHPALILAITALVVVCGCGDTAPSAATTPEAEPAEIQRDKPPHTITCGDLADKQGSAALTRRAQFALADKAGVEDMSRLRVAQSIFFAMTELCKGAENDYTPAADAVRAVRSGKYLADLGAP